MSEKIKPWKLLESKPVIDSKFFPVRQDICELPNNTVIDDYFVVDEADWVTILAVTAENEVVLVKQYRHGIQDVVLEVVAGVVDKEIGEGVDAARIAAVRELAEETGYQVEDENLIYLGWRNPNSARYANKAHMFLATDLKNQSTQNLDATEDIEVVKIPMNEFITIAFSTILPNASHLPVIVSGLEHLGILRLSNLDE